MSSVSIIIPCYNKRRFVAETIESALSQTVKCEVIVVDDGSTDGSLDVIRSYGNSVRWFSGKNLGGSAARNVGLSMATGSWIQFLDADDRISKNKIALQLRALQGEPQDCMATCSWHFFGDDGAMKHASPRSFWRNHDVGIDLLLEMWSKGGFFPCHSWLMPRSLVEQIGGWNAELSSDDDGEFFGRALVAAGRVIFVSDAEAGYRYPQVNGVSRSVSRRAAESAFRSWELTAQLLTEKRTDAVVASAIIRRLQRVSYGSLSAYHDLLYEAELASLNWKSSGLNESLPPVTRWLVALFGINRGLRLRNRLLAFRTVRDKVID